MIPAGDMRFAVDPKRTCADEAGPTRRIDVGLAGSRRGILLGPAIGRNEVQSLGLGIPSADSGSEVHGSMMPQVGERERNDQRVRV
jgi:hypothetical protein